MKGSYVISCCSAADLTLELIQKLDVELLCFHLTLDGVQYTDDLGQSMDINHFYAEMAAGKMTKTSQIGIGEYMDHFEKFLAAGQDVLHITLSSGISGTFNSATAAAQVLASQYPERRLVVMDSLAASSGYGLLMAGICQERDKGASLDELIAYIERERLHLNHWFFSTDLQYYVRGGRISKASGFVGGLLNICPLLNVNKEGKLIPRTKCRGKRKAIETIVQRMEEHARDGHDYDGPVYLSQSACKEDAEAVVSLIRERFPKVGEISIFNIGALIGAHTGPGTVALFFWGDERGE